MGGILKGIPVKLTVQAGDGFREEDLTILKVDDCSRHAKNPTPK
jgi:hypothetical protein